MFVCTGIIALYEAKLDFDSFDGMHPNDVAHIRPRYSLTGTVKIKN